MARMKVTLREGQRRVTQVGTPKKATIIAGQVGQVGRAIEGLEMAGGLLGLFPTRQLAWMVAEAGLLPTASGGDRPWEAHYLQEYPSQRIFKGGLKRPQRYWPEMVVFHKLCWYQRSTKLLICKWPFA